MTPSSALITWLPADNATAVALSGTGDKRWAPSSPARLRVIGSGTPGHRGPA